MQSTLSSLRGSFASKSFYWFSFGFCCNFVTSYLLLIGCAPPNFLSYCACSFEGSNNDSPSTVPYNASPMSSIYDPISAFDLFLKSVMRLLRFYEGVAPFLFLLFAILSRSQLILLNVCDYEMSSTLVLIRCVS